MASELTIVPATGAHAEALAPHLRQAHLEEVAESGYSAPLECLLDSIRRSAVARVALVGGEVAVLFGVVDHAPGVGLLWQMGGQVVERHPVAFVRAARPEIDTLQLRWPMLVSLIGARHTVALRLVKLLGFEVQPESVGRNGVEYRIARRRHV